ncbi:hypothetical protein [Streptomyces silvisoli]|uniref:Uncharacterized protein n=1 Tax=Streptomyces silvisoli TaxID=3034235 RepID=A0ABT5ZTV7_9ACTN|nr:hypothetical protein [Streptomyces silvisoli]MDF3293262.1 hypothetical protein [Streptomyces silvisoli]
MAQAHLLQPGGHSVSVVGSGDRVRDFQYVRDRIVRIRRTLPLSSSLTTAPLDDTR